MAEDGFAQTGGKGDGVISDKVMWKGARCGIGSVDEVKVNEDGTLSYIRRLNGDQDHQGRPCAHLSGRFPDTSCEVV